jgi:hypothetical protein
MWSYNLPSHCLKSPFKNWLHKEQISTIFKNFIRHVFRLSKYMNEDLGKIWKKKTVAFLNAGPLVARLLRRDPEKKQGNQRTTEVQTRHLPSTTQPTGIHAMWQNQLPSKQIIDNIFTVESLETECAFWVPFLQAWIDWPATDKITLCNYDTAFWTHDWSRNPQSHWHMPTPVLSTLQHCIQWFPSVHWSVIPVAAYPVDTEVWNSLQIKRPTRWDT